MQKLLKKKDIIDYVLHEVSLLAVVEESEVSMFRTPLAVVKHFSASGEAGLASQFRNGESNSDGDFEHRFALQFAEFRDVLNVQKTQALVDFMWSVWGRHLR